MFYIKTIHNGSAIKVDIYDDEIYTRCYNCGKEIQVDTHLLREILKDDCDLSSTSINCCPDRTPRLVRVK